MWRSKSGPAYLASHISEFLHSFFWDVLRLILFNHVCRPESKIWLNMFAASILLYLWNCRSFLWNNGEKQEQSAIQGANRVPCIFIPDENRFILNAHSKQNQKTLLAGVEPNTGQIKNPAISRNHNITSTVAKCGQQPWYIQRSFAYIMFQVSTCIYGNRTLPSGMSFHKTSGPKPRKHVPSSTWGTTKPRTVDITKRNITNIQHIIPCWTSTPNTSPCPGVSTALAH